MVMRRATRGSAFLAVWLVSVSVVAAQQPTNFVSCPIVRDTASVPCWLAEYGGEHRIVLDDQQDARIRRQVLSIILDDRCRH